MKTYERDGVIYIAVPEIERSLCQGCAALDFKNDASECGGFPPSDTDEYCLGSIWIKSPEQKK